ncbi:HNH endonuclease [Edwardsiella piscicida]
MDETNKFSDVFLYDPHTGILKWKKDTGKKRMVGKIAGHQDTKGYLAVGCFDKDHRVHRIAWEMSHGKIPDGMQVDHINGIKSDNRLSNLRLVYHQENQRNMAIPKSNNSGVLGVSWDARSGKWRAKIMINRKTVHLGRFPSIELAAKARKEAEIRYGFHENHGRKP